ncbi:hypothetical protein ACW9KT_03200 [Hymenobacter sp. HD11105]
MTAFYLTTRFSRFTPLGGIFSMSQSSAAFTPADRDAALLSSRPLVATAFLPPTAEIATAGDFLHRTLRPVLKLQNELLLLLVADFVQEHHIPFSTAGVVEQQRLIGELLTRNVKLRYLIVGTVVGLFTQTELAYYRPNRAELNRRLLELATRRVQDQVEAVAALAAR